jgi:hemerythrin-like domain-containing protein
MKRHPSLHTLSRDHHHALVQARKLNLAAAANDPTGLAQAAEQFAAFWENDLQFHFWQEERIVLPVLSKQSSPDVVAETLSQHAEIKRLIEELNVRLARRTSLEAGMLGVLAEALRRHIRFEENELFPAVESAATEEDLRQMSEQLETERSRTGQGGCALPPKAHTTEE